MLHSINTRGWDTKTAWCVPTAVSFLSGAPLIHSHSRAAFIQGIALDQVKGVYGSEAAMLLKEQGYRSKVVDLTERYDDAPKLKKFLADRSAYEKCVPMLIQLEKAPNFCHVVSCHFDYVADNWTMKPVLSKDHPHINKYVTKAWVVEKAK